MAAGGDSDMMNARRDRDDPPLVHLSRLAQMLCCLSHCCCCVVAPPGGSSAGGAAAAGCLTWKGGAAEGSPQIAVAEAAEGRRGVGAPSGGRAARAAERRQAALHTGLSALRRRLDELPCLHLYPDAHKSASTVRMASGAASAPTSSGGGGGRRINTYLPAAGRAFGTPAVSGM